MPSKYSHNSALYVCCIRFLFPCRCEKLQQCIIRAAQRSTEQRSAKRSDAKIATSALMPRTCAGMMQCSCPPQPLGPHAGSLALDQFQLQSSSSMHCCWSPELFQTWETMEQYNEAKKNMKFYPWGTNYWSCWSPPSLVTFLPQLLSLILMKCLPASSMRLR